MIGVEVGPGDVSTPRAVAPPAVTGDANGLYYSQTRSLTGGGSIWLWGYYVSTLWTARRSSSPRAGLTAQDVDPANGRLPCRVSHKEAAKGRIKEDAIMGDRTECVPAALYARVSSDRQDVDLSVAAQLRALNPNPPREGGWLAS